jgi:release factor glutamine methyltransferase
MNLRQAVTNAAAQFAADSQLHGNAQRDAELLLLHILQLHRATLLAYPDRELSPDERAQYEGAIARRLLHEPIQYITGEQEFYGLAMHVTPSVLIPRPETEHLVEAVLKLLPADKPQAIADIGTGSGAIAIALAAHLPLAQITALDISPEALAVAESNARKHNVANRIRFVQSDLFAAVSDEPATFDAIVSNPPYVAETDRRTLSREVRDYEPATALFAGETGLDVYRRLIPGGRVALKAGGLLALEIGQGQRDAVQALLQGWEGVSFLNDLQRIPRVALARSPASSATL